MLTAAGFTTVKTWKHLSAQRWMNAEAMWCDNGLHVHITAQWKLLAQEKGILP